MTKVAIIGSNGYVGSALVKTFTQEGVSVTPVTRESYDKYKSGSYDIIIHAAMPSKRWWSQNHPYEDFIATTQLTADIVYNWRAHKTILISSVSARVQLDHPYGINKRAAEVLVQNSNSNNLVVRLGGLYGNGLNKGVIFDMKQGNEVFMSGQSAFNYIDTHTAAELIYNRLTRSGLIEVGAKNTIQIKAIAQHFNWDVSFGERYEYQDTINPEDDFPLAEDVLDFIANFKA